MHASCTVIIIIIIIIIIITTTIINHQPAAAAHPQVVLDAQHVVDALQQLVLVLEHVARQAPARDLRVARMRVCVRVS